MVGALSLDGRMLTGLNSKKVVSLADRPKLAPWGLLVRMWIVGRNYLILQQLLVFEQT